MPKCPFWTGHHLQRHRIFKRLKQICNASKKLAYEINICMYLWTCNLTRNMLQMCQHTYRRELKEVSVLYVNHQLIGLWHEWLSHCQFSRFPFTLIFCHVCRHFQHPAYLLLNFFVKLQCLLLKNIPLTNSLILKLNFFINFFSKDTNCFSWRHSAWKCI